LHELQTQSLQVLALAVCGDHAHLLVELPDDYQKAKRWMGRLKQRSSHAVGEALTGKLWAKGGKSIRIKNQAHQQQVFHYILRHYDQGGWVWSFRDGPRDPSKS
jgi:REP element-mobilizing transposase RayT